MVFALYYICIPLTYNVLVQNTLFNTLVKKDKK